VSVQSIIVTNRRRSVKIQMTQHDDFSKREVEVSFSSGNFMISWSEAMALSTALSIVLDHP